MLRLIVLCAATFAVSSLTACAGAYYGGDIGRHRGDDDRRRMAPQAAGADRATPVPIGRTSTR